VQPSKAWITIFLNDQAKMEVPIEATSQSCAHQLVAIILLG
jgi:hypothetical protein